MNFKKLTLTGLVLLYSLFSTPQVKPLSNQEHSVKKIICDFECGPEGIEWCANGFMFYDLNSDNIDEIIPFIVAYPAGGVENIVAETYGPIQEENHQILEVIDINNKTKNRYHKPVFSICIYEYNKDPEFLTFIGVERNRYEDGNEDFFRWNGSKLIPIEYPVK